MSGRPTIKIMTYEEWLAANPDVEPENRPCLKCCDKHGVVLISSPNYCTYCQNRRYNKISKNMQYLEQLNKDTALAKKHNLEVRRPGG